MDLSLLLLKNQDFIKLAINYLFADTFNIFFVYLRHCFFFQKHTVIWFVVSSKKTSTKTFNHFCYSHNAQFNIHFFLKCGILPIVSQSVIKQFTDKTPHRIQEGEAKAQLHAQVRRLPEDVPQQLDAGRTHALSHRGKTLRVPQVRHALFLLQLPEVPPQDDTRGREEAQVRHMRMQVQTCEVPGQPREEMSRWKG